jgi:hypothetical protein
LVIINQMTEFPFFYEIAVVSSNSIPYYLNFMDSLNSSIMPGNYSFLVGNNSNSFQWQTQSDRKNDNYRNSRSIFDVLEYYGYSFKKEKSKKPPYSNNCQPYLTKDRLQKLWQIHYRFVAIY